MEPPWQGVKKVYINGPGHMIKMAAMPIYSKAVKNLLLQNHKSYDLLTWHVALGTQALQSLYNDDLDLLRQGQIWSPVRFNGENCYKVI